MFLSYRKIKYICSFGKLSELALIVNSFRITPEVDDLRSFRQIKITLIIIQA